MPNGRRKPVGFGVYKALHGVKWGKRVPRLTQRGYRVSPSRAWESLLGLKPRRVTTASRQRFFVPQVGRFGRR